MPLTFEVSLQEKEMLESRSAVLKALGFEVTPFSGNTYALHAVPAIVKIKDPIALTKSLFHDLTEGDIATSFEDLQKRALKSVACKSAIAFGDSLTPEEQRALITTLEQTQNNQSCIHGRPTRYTITMDELARWFKRR
jgi:DNA mismatch repair protein MutL